MIAPKDTQVRSRGAPRYRLTARDRGILFAVGRMGQGTAEQVRRLFFGRDPSTAFRRLRKLVELGLLERHVLSESTPNIYILTTAGYTVLTAGGVAPHELHRPKIGRHHNEHLERLNDVRVAFVVASRGQSDFELAAFHGDLDLRRAAGASPPPYIPDGIAELRLQGGVELALMLEIDLGTEGASVFAGKVKETIELWRTGSKCWGARAGLWRPVALVMTASRARSLSRAIVALGGGELWLLAELERVHAVGVLGAVLATAKVITSTPKNAPIPYQSALAGAPADAAQERRS